jgi:hypothetical protein
MRSDPERTAAGVLLPTAADGALRSFFDYYGRCARQCAAVLQPASALSDVIGLTHHPCLV